tara:strand:+ start:110 stop:1039 length:930 start_codon:yes stop_codon:yes gene_type:complete
MSIPWVEKYRPNNFDGLILDPLNRKILMNILDKNFVPNLLFYGPPGTGKTTTIINLINSYQEKYNQKSKGLIIHLNASDERGIDIIRNQINKFVNSKTLFNEGVKFVILDEVDYMTKNAQQALCYLLQKQTANVRFCLICNYISKIEEQLQNEFIKLRFNQLPKREIVDFLTNIIHKESVNIPNVQIENIQTMFQSDIRSMINYIQLNQNDLTIKKILDDKKLETIINFITKNDIDKNREYLHILSIEHCIEIKNIIRNLINYIIRMHSQLLNKNFLNMIEFLLHEQDIKLEDYVNYSLLSFAELSKSA